MVSRLSSTERWLAVLIFIAAAGMPQRAHSQPAQPVSRSIAIVIDDSSAAGRHQADIARSVQAFLKFLTPSDEACIFAAKEKPALWQDFTSDEDVLADRVRKLYGRGKLALYDTVAAAAQHLQNEASNDSIALVVFAATEDDASRIKLHDLAQSAAAKVPTFVVAGPNTDWRIQEPFEQLAFQSGGRAYFADNGGELGEIARQAAWKITGHLEVADKSEEKPLAPYKAVVVPSIPVTNSKATEQISGGDNILLHRMLVARLRKSGLFSEVIDAGNESASPASLPGRVELLATIVGYQRGSRTKREFLAFGGGTHLKVQVVMREPGSQQPVSAFVTESNASSGLFGGSDEKLETEAIIRAADQIVAELRNRK